MRQGGPRERSRSAKERRAKDTREWRRTRWVARRLGRDKKAGVGSRRYSGGGREGRVGARETATGCNFVQRERARATRRRRSETESFVGTYGEGWKKNERGDATRGRVGECSARESHLTGGREKGYIRRVPLLRGGLGIGAAHRTHEEGNSHAVHVLPLAPRPASPHPTTSPRTLPLNPRFLLLLLLVLLRWFLRLDFAATLPVLFRIAVLRLVESEDSQTNGRSK